MSMSPSMTKIVRYIKLFLLTWLFILALWGIILATSFTINPNLYNTIVQTIGLQDKLPTSTHIVNSIIWKVDPTLVNSTNKQELNSDVLPLSSITVTQNCKIVNNFSTIKQDDIWLLTINCWMKDLPIRLVNVKFPESKGCWITQSIKWLQSEVEGYTFTMNTIWTSKQDQNVSYVQLLRWEDDVNKSIIYRGYGSYDLQAYINEWDYTYSQSYDFAKKSKLWIWKDCQ